MAWSAIKRRQLEDDFGSFEFQFQTQKRIRSSRVSETQRNVAVEEKSTVGLPLRKGLASSATKNADPESEDLGFDEICQTQKRKRSSRVFENQRNVAVEKKSTVGLPLCMGLASSATKNANPESEEGFDEICQTQKRKRSSRVSETQRKEKSTADLPLRKVKGLVSSASKETLDCSKVLDSLMNLGHASYFNKPVVDPVAENLPGYFDEIWRPMDLGTVKSKLEKGVYSSADGFAADVRLIFSNAFRYFPLGSRNRAAAKHLSGVFETQWKEAEEKMSKTACPPPTPPLPKRRPNGNSSSACRVLIQSQEHLGLYLKEDDELQGQDEEAFLNADQEEGEICWQESDWEEGEIRS
ncbi:hypothetical protein GBA52_026179 [Prunus armeniaca]|nr:hypothetical protein GBA52_026179 [Prunus armeniaca]